MIPAKIARYLQRNFLGEDKSWGQSPFNTLLTPEEAHCLFNTVKVLGQGNYADLGVMFGGSTAIIGHALSLARHPGTIYAVDLFGQIVKDKVIGSSTASEKLITYFKKFPMLTLQTCKGTTDEWADKLDIPFNFIFIDADHSYEAVKKDFEKWSPKVKIGGCIGFHDTDLKSVSTAIEQVKLNNWSLIEHIDSLKIFKREF